MIIVWFAAVCQFVINVLFDLSNFTKIFSYMKFWEHCQWVVCPLSRDFFYAKVSASTSAWKCPETGPQKLKRLGLHHFDWWLVFILKYTQVTSVFKFIEVSKFTVVCKYRPG